MCFVQAFRAGSADALHRNMHLFDAATRRKRPDRMGLGSLFQTNIKDIVAAGAEKMGMGLKIGAVA